MSKKSKLEINAAVCDMTEVSESVLQQYDTVTVRAATVVMSPESKELAAVYDVELDAACVIQIAAGSRLCVKNGNFIIDENTEAAPTDVLLVNGCLDITAGGQGALEKYQQIVVNGTVRYPDKLASQTVGIQLNGSPKPYPSDAVLRGGNVNIDRIFALRAAEGGKYYITGKVFMLDCPEEVRTLKEKRTMLLCKEAFVTESILEEALGLFHEDVPITALEDGTRILNDADALSEESIIRAGKLYAMNDMMLRSEHFERLKTVQSLRVRGKIICKAEDYGLYQNVAGRLECEGVQVQKGRAIHDFPSVEVDRPLLEQCTEGLEIIDCGTVHIHENVPTALILDKLHIQDCGVVTCTKEQKGSILLVCSDVAKVTSKHRESENDAHRDTCRINAALYKM